MTQPPTAARFSPLRALRRLEEIGDDLRDPLGNFDAQHADRRWAGPLYFPVVNDRLVAEDPSWLDEISWPDGKTFAACLTHDVDFAIIDSRRELVRSVVAHLRDPEAGTDRLRHLFSLVGMRKGPKRIDMFTPWLEAETRYGFKSTFFFFPTAVRQRSFRDCTYRWDDSTWFGLRRVRMRDVVVELNRRGWEPGLHASINTARSADDVQQEKADLEAVVGTTVASVRQHNLRFDVATTPEIQHRAGFRIDSTLGFNRDVGFRAGIAYPFRLWDTRERRWLNLVEIPLVLQDGALLRADNLGLGVSKAIEVGKLLIDRVRASKGVITLLWHPHVVDMPGWMTVYEELLAYIHRRNGWGASAGSIARWWQQQGLDMKLQARLERLGPVEDRTLEHASEAAR